MSGCLFPARATVDLLSAKSLFTYCRSIVMFGFAASKSFTIRWIERYSYDWLMGGGGVYPIHIVRLTGAADPPTLAELVPLLLPPLVHAAATSTSVIGNATIQVRLIELPPF